MNLNWAAFSRRLQKLLDILIVRNTRVVPFSLNIPFLPFNCHVAYRSVKMGTY